jgi:hypothetical protein
VFRRKNQEENGKIFEQEIKGSNAVPCDESGQPCLLREATAIDIAFFASP